MVGLVTPWKMLEENTAKRQQKAFAMKIIHYFCICLIVEMFY